MSDLIYEGDVADQLGLDRKELARVRKGLDLAKETDWAYGAHRRLMLTPDGVKKIVAAVEMASGEAARAAALVMPQTAKGAENDAVSSNECAFEPVTPIEVVAVVLRVPAFSKLMVCQLEGESINVRVQDNKNFKQGMRVPVREAVGSDRIWYYNGPMPKRHGVLPGYDNTEEADASERR